ncbi:MAG: tRNA pseudouridine(38-40) synthase TruA [Halocynthiibacter sp.]
MPRFALKIEYSGAPFFGWQRQKNHPSVQQAIEEALAKIDPAEPTLVAAGRTDTGVHALGQVAHCDLSRGWDSFRLSEAINYHLKPSPVAILQAAPVDDDFSARFSALERHYLFRLLRRRAPVPLGKGLVWQVPRKPDMERMQDAAAHLIGHHDFTTFRSTMCQARSPVKTLDELRIEARETPQGRELRFFLRARSFLHNQVRSIVGSLVWVGAGTWSANDLRLALARRDRAACGPVCPPHGLYLQAVRYERDPFAAAEADWGRDLPGVATRQA